MAKKSMLQREEKRKKLVLKYSEKRLAILKKLKLTHISELERIFNLNEKLQKLPRNSSKNRLRNRCWKTGRPRGFFRYFGLCRNALREFANECFLPGIIKASW
jgi:small subunit ribosomal protein S14